MSGQTLAPTILAVKSRAVGKSSGGRSGHNKWARPAHCRARAHSPYTYTRMHRQVAPASVNVCGDFILAPGAHSPLRGSPATLRVRRTDVGLALERRNARPRPSDCLFVRSSVRPFVPIHCCSVFVCSCARVPECAIGSERRAPGTHYGATAAPLHCCCTVPLADVQLSRCCSFQHHQHQTFRAQIWLALVLVISGAARRSRSELDARARCSRAAGAAAGRKRARHFRLANSEHKHGAKVNTHNGGAKRNGEVN